MKKDRNNGNAAFSCHLKLTFMINRRTMQSYCNADNFGEDFIYCSMSIDHAKLKAIALLKLDSFVKAFTEINSRRFWEMKE